MNALTSRLDKIEKALAPKSRTGRTYEQLEEWEKALLFIGDTQWTALTWPGCEVYKKLDKEIGYNVHDSEMARLTDEELDALFEKAYGSNFSYIEHHKEEIEQAASNIEVLQYVDPQYRDHLREFLILRHRENDARLYDRLPKGVHFRLDGGKVIGRRFTGNDFVDMSDKEIQEILG